MTPGTADPLAGLDEQRRRWVEKAWGEVDRERLRELTVGLVDIASPTGDEAPLARHITDTLAAGGVEAHTMYLDDRQANSWARVRGKLRAEMGETAYRNWLKKLTFLQIRGHDVELAVPTRFVRDWIVAHYQDRLRSLWQAENPALRAVARV